MGDCMNMFRQGDVLLVKVSNLPDNVEKIDTDIILRGEATGHAHRIINGQIFQFKDFRGIPVGTMYIYAEIDSEIVHDEHKSIRLEKGIYEVVRQREFNPVFKTSPRVID